MSPGDNLPAPPLVASAAVRDCDGIRLSASPRTTEPGARTANVLLPAAADSTAEAFRRTRLDDRAAGAFLPTAAADGTADAFLRAGAKSAPDAAPPAGEGAAAVEVPDPRSIDPYQAVVEYPELAPLLALAERTDTGWHFGPMYADGELVAIQGLRTGAGYLDVIRVYGPNRVVVARAWLVGERAGEFLFNREGHPAEVIPALLSLPDPE